MTSTRWQQVSARIPLIRNVEPKKQTQLIKSSKAIKKPQKQFLSKGGLGFQNQEESKSAVWSESEEENQIINTCSKKVGKDQNPAGGISQIGGKIEPVSYEMNQELLRAFGQPVTASFQAVQSLSSANKNATMNVREPVYCFCQSVSYGDMIACDNQACPYEWFHFPCVGLLQKPEGKWYCQKCILLVD